MATTDALPLASPLTLRALRIASNDATPHPVHVRRQAAVVRALIDQIERSTPNAALDASMREQLLEELNRLSGMVVAPLPGA